ncbi:MAG: DUF202 domain-containing protein [Nitriliruptoraceae bacterium]
MSGDPGLQPERTSLAWRRTGLAAATATAAMLRLAVVRETPVIAALCAGLLVISLGALLEGSSRSAARRRWFEDDSVLVGLSLTARATVAAVTALAGAGLALVALS